MKCPYCSAEVTGSKCEYCGSDLSDLIKESKVARNRAIKEEVDEEYDDEEYDEDEYEDEEDDYEDGEELTEEDYERILKLCRRIQKKYPNAFSVYDEEGELLAGNGVKDKLFDVLEIPDDEQVFLIHDDTLFGTGGNGFAITDCGFYCLRLTEDLVYTDFSDIEEDDETDYDNSTVYLKEDEVSLAYFSGNQGALADLCDLYDDIFDILFE